MRIALAQLRIEAGDVEGNVDRACRAVERAGDRSADLVALPELFTVGYFAFDRYPDAAESVTGPTVERLAEAATTAGVAVVAGSIVEDLGASRAAGVETPAPEGLANATVFLDRDGRRRAVYRKRHLFGYDSTEADLLTPGESLPAVEFEGFTVGTTTCYDLRFPELYRDLLDRGTTLTVVPSAWPHPRVEHWRLLPRARAVENLSYVATVNGVGSFTDAELLGRSTVYDPWGTAVAGATEEAGLVTADVSPERVERVRDEFPALADRH